MPNDLQETEERVPVRNFSRLRLGVGTCVVIGTLVLTGPALVNGGIAFVQMGDLFVRAAIQFAANGAGWSIVVPPGGGLVVLAAAAVLTYFAARSGGVKVSIVDENGHIRVKRGELLPP